MAAHRKQHKRKRKRSRLGPLFKLLCGVAVLVAVTMGATVFFQVETIVVTGNQRYTQEEIIQATGIQIGDNLFRMNKYEIYDRMSQELPYIEGLQIRRGLPSTILVTISEWDAVAQILPSEERVPLLQEQEERPETAKEPWLISVGGKLLEPAGTDTATMKVSGLTLLMPRAGTQMSVPQEESIQETALLSLLSELENQNMLQSVNRIELKNTVIELEYLNRYTVKLPLNGDFPYKLQALQAAVLEREQALGSNITGSFDLTQKNYTAIYSPER